MPGLALIKLSPRIHCSPKTTTTKVSLSSSSHSPVLQMLVRMAYLPLLIIFSLSPGDNTSLIHSLLSFFDRCFASFFGSFIILFIKNSHFLTLLSSPGRIRKLSSPWIPVTNSLCGLRQPTALFGFHLSLRKWSSWVWWSIVLQT